MDSNELTPPPPRKLPQQERSRRMVAAIVDSCKKILTESGEEALTMTALEAVSGVTKGSIYQYFPNLDGIVGALFEREFEEFLHVGTDRLAEVKHSANLQEMCEVLIVSAANWHHTMQSLHSSYYEQYNLYFDAGKRFTELDADLAVAQDYVLPSLKRSYSKTPLKHPRETANLILQLLNSLFFSALRHYPQRILDSDFHSQVVHTCIAFAEQAQRKPL